MSYDHDDNALNLEYKWKGDDAWYAVGLLLNMETETLTVNFTGFPATWDMKFTTDDFQSTAELDEFVNSFRPCSQQVQDTKCSKEIIEGVKVCASYKNADDLKFYDAIIEAVHHEEHSIKNGEEECLCTFIITWLHGPKRGTLTSIGIESLCNIIPCTQIHPKLSIFIDLTKVKIIHKSASSSRKRSKGLKSTLCKDKEELDRDIGGDISNHDYLIVIGNMEKDVGPTLIKEFLHQQTSVIISHAYVLPCFLQDELFTKGAIEVDSGKKVKKIYDFLTNPNHLIVSTRGRPWVVLGMGTKQEFIGINLVNSFEFEVIDGSGLRVIYYESEEYKRARHKRDVFKDFEEYKKVLQKKLVYEENKDLV